MRGPGAGCYGVLDGCASALAGLGGLERGGLLVCTCIVAFSMSPSTIVGQDLSEWKMLSSMSLRWSGEGFFSTQFTTCAH